MVAKVSTSPVPETVVTHHQPVQLRKSLKLRHVVIIGLAYLTPMTVFDSFVIVSNKTHGHVPSAYILALIAVLFTAMSYGNLVRQFPQAGSAYTYANKAISYHVGFMVGWLSLSDYMLLPMINVLLVKIYLSALFPFMPDWIWVVGCVFVMTISNLKGVNWVANLNTLLVLFQLMILIVFVYLVWKGLQHGEGTGTVWTFEPFFSEHAKIIPIIAGASILCFSFLGFDAVSTLSEETHNPNKVIPKAIFLTAFLGGVIFIGVSFFIQLYFPHQGQLTDPDSSLPDIALFVGGRFFQSILLCCAVVGALASGIASHASISRLLFVMGRDGVFYRKAFAYIHPKWHTPVFNILLVGFVGLLAIFFDLEMAITFINFGALIAFTFVNLSVINHYFIRQKRRYTVKDVVLFLIMPILGAVLLAGLWVNLAGHALLLGCSWGVIGLLYLAYLTRGFRKPPPRVSDAEIPLAE